jgi:hypothetical protein
MQRMMDSSRTISGMKTVDELKLDNEQANAGAAVEGEGAEDQAKRIVIPAEKFKDFKEITSENEDLFKYVVDCIVTQFLEHCPDTAIEFP